MTDFSKILDQAKNLQSKMKESQDRIKLIQAEGESGGGSVKIVLNGDGEMIKIYMSPEILKESKEIIEDLIIAAYGNAKKKIKLKTTEELSKVTGDMPLPPGFKWPF